MFTHVKCYLFSLGGVGGCGGEMVHFSRIFTILHPWSSTLCSNLSRFAQCWSPQSSTLCDNLSRFAQCRNPQSSCLDAAHVVTLGSRSVKDVGTVESWASTHTVGQTWWVSPSQHKNNSRKPQTLMLQSSAIVPAAFCTFSQGYKHVTTFSKLKCA